MNTMHPKLMILVQVRLQQQKNLEVQWLVLFLMIDSLKMLLQTLEYLKVTWLVIIFEPSIKYWMVILIPSL